MAPRVPNIDDALLWAHDPNATEQQLYVAADTLVSWGQLDLADQIIEKLRANPAYGRGLNRLSAASRQLRRSGVLDDLAAFSAEGGEVIDGRHEAFTARYDGETRKAIIVFTGIDPRFWLSLMMLHLFLKRLNTHIIYLTDLRQLIFFDGLETVARGYDGLRDALRGTLDNLGADEVHVMANSAGGFAGLRYAIDLQAKSFLGMSIRTDLSVDSRIPVGGFFKRQGLRDVAPHMLIDLKPELIKSRYPERVVLYSGDGNPVDRPHALHLADLPRVEVNLLPDHVQHDVMAGLLARGQLEDVLRDFVYGAGPSTAGNAP
ncbi:hypothetical protein [Bauldia litoralis]|uniref:hypothetical protein n=1 Tax=Bauldia litoralis TaxID=665467 RepID=UPI003265B711